MRRRWCAAMAATTLLATALAGCGSSDDDGGTTTAGAKQSGGVELRVLEAGGASGEAMQKAYIAPFEQATGNSVVRASPSEMGKLQAQVRTGKVTDSIVELDSIQAVAAGALGLTEPIDYAAVRAAPMDPAARHENALCYQYYSTIPAWRAGARALPSVQQFFDVDGYPGKRSLPDYPTFALPLAAVADGVPLDRVFPLDVDRAFAALDRIKDDVDVWWSSGAQPAQLLRDGEVDYALAWSGRIAAQDGIEHTYDGGLLDLGCLVVPRGAPHVEQANALLHEYSLPANQAELARLIPYSGPAEGMARLVAPERAKLLPTGEGNRDVQFLQDPEWWAANYEDVLKRWEAWKLSR
ncbi:extracellular solute-binding protein [Conexibacter woesei]|uniref:Extracellular solute-binding protein n=1 Tax=Conexibacter woesei (strain DSM 14684 / CCUG 47730 / CIP 108061 / JCM 11494 / NBRC 100937 / ID131577) TaxID=469383 RepID=D3FC59_CONWI|nr:extracellular solute-binding protein [Conexibacter woesei]ADB53354.1 extracellular solute-binding protein [Conexibacter woesei DSM 14684]